MNPLWLRALTSALVFLLAASVIVWAAEGAMVTLDKSLAARLLHRP